jgi:D-alanine-D-alanine ligase
MQQPYTGCNPRGLTLGHDKVLCKQILTYHRIPTPRFVVFLRNKVIRPQRKLKYPLLVKSVIEEASLGITRDSIVYTDKQLVDRVLCVHEEVNTDALVEEFIEGREFYVGVMGNQRLQAFPVWELLFKNLPDDIPNIATARVKWDIEYQRELGVTTRAVTDLPAASIRKIVKLCKHIYRALYLSGYARIDLRVNPEGQIYVPEANPNPDLSYGEDFAESANTIDISYEKLLTRIVNLGLRYQPSWRG